MSKNQFTGTATQPQRNRNTTTNVVNLIMTSTVTSNIVIIEIRFKTKKCGN